YWNHVLCSNEIKINLCGLDGVQHVWRDPGQENQENCVFSTVRHGGGSIMVWGCINAAGAGELWITISFFSVSFFYSLLSKCKITDTHTHIIHIYILHCFVEICMDNAKPHFAHITKSWLRRKRVWVLDWPTCSPDLSPIENVWRISKRKMRQQRPRTVAHLKTCLQEEWGKITSHHLVSLVPKNLLSVVKNLPQSGKF
ncbi:hypothetical protein C0J50_11322, partial [Silurus asotus]